MSAYTPERIAELRKLLRPTEQWVPGSPEAGRDYLGRQAEAFAEFGHLLDEIERLQGLLADPDVEPVPPEDCHHEAFSTFAEVVRLTDGEGGEVTGFTTNLRVQCAACGELFTWRCPDVGVSQSRPMVSADGLELRAPIAPVSAGESLAERLGAHMRPQAKGDA